MFIRSTNRPAPVSSWTSIWNSSSVSPSGCASAKRSSLPPALKTGTCATLSLITFSELLVGFLLIRQRYSLLLAFLITLLDALPVFGTGTALVPWAVFTLLFGFPPKAIVLLALYLCTLITRNTLEPKLLSAQAGLPPIASLMAMYLGARAFGVAGMVLFPLLLLLAAQMLRTKKEGSM